MQRLVNPFEQSGKWYKANLHTHTTISDGKLSVPERVAQYRKAGYDILAITDHYVTNDIRGLSDKKMLVISGMEYHPPCPTTKGPYHILAVNIPYGFKFNDDEDANNCIAKVKKAGGESILAHPFWSGQAYEDFRCLRGLAAVEIYNSTCDRHGQSSSENEWAYCLDRGHILSIVGNDDTHWVDSEDVCECWTWFKMPSLSVANVLASLRSGASYASCGPKIHDFRINGGKVRLRCSSVTKIHFIGGPGQGVRRRAGEGNSIMAHSIDIPDNWPYVRAVAVDAAGRRAWTNPIAL